MRKQRITICNKLGLHARAAAKLVQVAAGFDCDITLKKDSKEVNGKSIMGVMMLAAGKGSEIEIVADGLGENEAVDQLDQLFRERFGEDE